MKLITLISILFLSFNSFSQSEFMKEIIVFQETLNKQYADTGVSPLIKKDLAIFKSLDFYPINEKYKVKAIFIITENADPFRMNTTTDRAPVYIEYGKIKFELDGKKIEMSLYQSHTLRETEKFKDYLMLPFKDLTSGKTSYGGGRYVDLKIPKGNTIIIDFNKAYNPYCAYNHKYSCVVPPAENNIPIEIKAGVKKYNDMHLQN